MLPDARTLFAAEVQYWRVEPAVWRPILERAIEAGLPGVSTYVPWEIHEIEKGRFDFDGSTDPKRDLIRYLELVKELGLRLAFRPGPFVCNEMDWGGHPRRIVMGDLDMMVLQADGRPAQGYHIARKEGNQPSYLHPKYLDEVRTWLAAVDGVASAYTMRHGGPIHTCNLDNELSYICRDSMFGSDYNGCVVGKGGLYHQFLTDKYGSPDRLPYEAQPMALEDVAPPRRLEQDLEANLQWYFDWIECKEWILARYLKVLRAMHEESGLDGVHFYTNLNPHRPEGIPTSFRRYSEATGGLVGYDFYRSPWLKYSGYSSMARVLKVMEATLPLVWSAEFMSGWWYTSMEGNRVPPNHIEFMGLSALANGCKALSWFMFHDRDAWGDSPVSEMGHARDSLGALKNVLAQVRELPEWNDLKPVMDFAIAYYRPYMWHCHLGDPAPCNDGALHVGDPNLWGMAAGESVAEYEGLFRMAQLAGYTPGCVDLTDAPDRLGEYRLLWFVAEPFMDADTASRLMDYVLNGGILVVNPSWPKVTWRGKPLDFLRMKGAPMTGERIGEFTVAACGKGTVIWLPRNLAKSEAGEESLTAISAMKVLLRALVGVPAVEARTPPVRWKTWAAGGGVGWKEEPRNLVDAILHKGGGAKVLFVANIHERAVTADVQFREELDGELREIEGTHEVLPLRSGHVHVTIDRKSVRVFRVV